MKTTKIFDIDNINTTAADNNTDFEFMYDSYEDIQKCLNCTKPECNNCLYWKNGV